MRVGGSAPRTKVSPRARARVRLRLDPGIRPRVFQPQGQELRDHGADHEGYA